MRILLADCNYHGFGNASKQLIVRARPSIEVGIVTSMLELKQSIAELEAGDVFIGMLTEMKPEGIWLRDQAIGFIEELEDELLPEGAKAILLDTQFFTQMKEVQDTIGLCLGRIILLPAPATTRKLLYSIDIISRAIRR